jgi:alkyl hydroperoxide reductase subunit AhpC
VDNHAKWAQDLAETQGTAPNDPMIGDTDLKVARLYNMLPYAAPGSPEGRIAPCAVRKHLLFSEEKRSKKDFIPTPTDQYRCAQSRIPIEMMRHG